MFTRTQISINAMFRSSFLLLALLTVVLIFTGLSAAQTKRMSGRKRLLLSSTRKPVSVKICGLALIRMLDLICTRARELLMRNEAPGKRQLQADDDPYSHTLSITDYARKRRSLFQCCLYLCLRLEFNDTLVGDCCLQACSVKTLLNYC